MENTISNKKINIEEEKEKTSNKFVNAIKEKYYKSYKFFANSDFMGCFKKTIVMTLPIIIIGVLIYFMLNLPIPGYQAFLDGSELKSFLDLAYEGTLGLITLYFTIILTYKYMRDKIHSFPIMIVVILTAVGCTTFLSAYPSIVNDSKEETEEIVQLINLGFDNIFLGIIFSFITVKVFSYFTNKKKIEYKVYTTEAHKTVILIANLLIPFTIVFIPTLIIFLVVVQTLQYSLVEFISIPFVYIFEHTNIELINGSIYAFIVNLGQFFGVGLSNSFSEAEMSGIINPTFMMTFVFVPLFFGFALSLLIFSKRKTDKIYGAAALPTSGLSLTSPIHYGYSMILNPFSLIPTLIVPIITTIVSYFLFIGFDIEIQESSDLVLIFYNGYKTTGSYWALLIQFISVAISGLIFIPFIRLNSYAKARAFKDNIKNLYPKYLEAKHRNKDVTIFDFDYELGETAKMLTTQLVRDMELMNEVRNRVIELNSRRDSYKVKEFEIGKRELLDKLKKQLKIKSYFQPIVGNNVTFDENGKPIEFEIKGMECLMRWWYNDNYIIPPLAIELARSAGLEYEINSYLWENMLINVDRKRCKSFITFNISMDCLENDNFVDDLMNLFDRYDMDPNGFVIEITEEDEFDNEAIALEKICTLKEKGFDFAIDDYGAGQTSMKYFQTNAFELVKIDGDLVKKAKENEQVFDIIGNIKELGKRGQKYANIQFKVLCEFIEDKEMFERLKELKVDYYQGYLFGKAVDFDDISSNPMLRQSRSQKHV